MGQRFYMTIIRDEKPWGPVMKRSIGPMIRVTHVVIFFLLLMLAAIIIETISHHFYSTDSGAAPLKIFSEEPLQPEVRNVSL